ncbi:MAG: acetoacetate decarboxylase [Acidimicrobiales bacterium]|nr:MAG: hypothetical protein EDR02_13600 [Actinomycetota bacterium]MBV6509746.1 acetoacetate decarboxylase [Acidimicrobiales bacterium]RIK04860.1 MAG: hypothetical protein DCC48_12540 [Acidobacteriota bacterium]
MDEQVVNYPITMPWSAPLFGPPPHAWKGVRMVAFPFAPVAETVERILPPAFEPGDGLGMITMLSYPPGETGIHPFNELVVLVPVRLGDIEGNYVPYIYVTTDEALIAGREIAGWPKRLADISWQREGTRFEGRVTRWGRPILTLEGELQGPLPVDAAGSAAADAPTLNYKLIPGPAGEIEIEEITLTRLEMQPRDMELGSATVSSENGPDDPLADLIPDGAGMLVAMVSDNTIPAGEVVQRIDRRVSA